MIKQQEGKGWMMEEPKQKSVSQFAVFHPVSEINDQS
jgi:hypothetical protein